MINNNIDFSSTTISITVLWTNIYFYFWRGLIDVHLTYHIHYDKKNHNITLRNEVFVFRCLFEAYRLFMTPVIDLREAIEKETTK